MSMREEGGMKERKKKEKKFLECFWFCLFMRWAIPGRTAIPGRPVARAEQAPSFSPQFKNQFNIVAIR